MKVPVAVGSGAYVDWGRVVSLAEYRQQTVSDLSAMYRRLDTIQDPSEIMDATVEMDRREQIVEGKLDALLEWQRRRAGRPN